MLDDRDGRRVDLVWVKGVKSPTCAGQPACGGSRSQNRRNEDGTKLHFDAGMSRSVGR
jgi:hypothetical protein